MESLGEWVHMQACADGALCMHTPSSHCTWPSPWAPALKQAPSKEAHRLSSSHDVTSEQPDVCCGLQHVDAN
jgi:hypothetical protein